MLPNLKPLVVCVEAHDQHRGNPHTPGHEPARVGHVRSRCSDLVRIAGVAVKGDVRACAINETTVRIET